MFLGDLRDRRAELNRLVDLGTDILNETGEFIHAMPYLTGSYEERTPLMLALRSEGSICEPRGLRHARQGSRISR